MYQFKKTLDPDNCFVISEVIFTLPHNDIGLEDILKEFELFLKACGYSFDGNLDIVTDEVDNE